MARRRRSRTTYKTYNVTYKQSTPGGQGLMSAILSLIVLLTLLMGVLLSCGPVMDYFNFVLMAQPENPYAAEILPMFPWFYVFITLSGAIGFVVVWRVVIRNIFYGRWND